jgi:hypothetical protein
LSGLRVRGKIFAMLIDGELVVKLPRDCVDQLVASGVDARFDSGNGRVMKEWVTVPFAHRADWNQLTNDAFAFADPQVVTGQRLDRQPGTATCRAPAISESSTSGIVSTS